MTNSQGSAYANGGATGTGAVTTTTVADDITPIASGAVNSITFSVYNSNSTTVTFDTTLSFWESNGTGSQPGTLLTSIAASPITLAANAGSLFTIETASTSGFFTAPDSLFWAGVTFSNSSEPTTTTAAELNDLAQLLFAPPTVGSSQDAFFKTSGTGQASTSNPSGGFYYFGGDPTADFAWAFSTVTATPPPTTTPEPASCALLLSGLGAMALYGRRKAAK